MNGYGALTSQIFLVVLQLSNLPKHSNYATRFNNNCILYATGFYSYVNAGNSRDNTYLLKGIYLKI